ncbi:MAG: hypothetical protein QGF09_12020, partial [Rhodospirillales bacterium]|nr:hypothetical protein [Rhodospirillales bacterium]
EADQYGWCEIAEPAARRRQKCVEQKHQQDARHEKQGERTDWWGIFTGFRQRPWDVLPFPEFNTQAVAIEVEHQAATIPATPTNPGQPANSTKRSGK